MHQKIGPQLLNVIQPNVFSKYPQESNFLEGFHKLAPNLALFKDC